LGAHYEKQVRNLEEKIRGLEELGVRRAGLQQQEVQLLQGQLMTASKEAEGMRRMAARRRVVYWVALVIVALVCVLVGRGCR
jgi:hypothetical protein